MVELAAFENWSMDGKLAVSNGEDGGSGRLEWHRKSELSEIDFRGAFGRGAWQLDIRPGQAVLEFANGESWEAPEVSTLVRTHVGWDIPVDALEWWIRGLVHPTGEASYELDEAGRINSLSQHGWTVEYQRYKIFSGMELPTRIEANKGNRRVKFVMREWSFPPDSEYDS